MRKSVMIAPVLGVLVFCFGIPAVHAADAAAPLSLNLDLAVSLAQKGNPSYRSTALDLRSAEISLAQTMSNNLLKPSPSGTLQSENSLSTARRNLEIAGIDLQVSVANAYFSLIKARNGVRVYENALKASEDNLSVVNEKLKAGVATNLDRIKAQADVTSKRANLEKARRNQELVEVQLEQVLGLPVETVLDLTTSPTYEPVTADLDKDMAHALANRLEIKQAQDTLRVRETEVRLNTNNYTAALTLQSSQVALEKAVIALEQAKNSVVQDVLNNHISLATAYNSIVSSQENVESNKENLRVVQLQYQANMLVNPDVISAQNTLLQSEIDMWNAMMDYQVARIKYAKSVCADTAKK